MTTKRSYSAKAACKVSFLLLVDVSLDTRFSWPVVFPLQDKSGEMQWLARASLRGPDGSISSKAAEHGLEADPPVSAPAFGTPSAPNSR